MFDSNSIPDIHCVREKALENEDEMQKQRKARAEKFQEYKRQMVEYYCNYFGIIINNKLERGIRAVENLTYRDVSDRLWAEYQFVAEDDECFDIMEEIVCKLGNAYTGKGYDFQLDKRRSNAVCTNDFYRFKINF